MRLPEIAPAKELIFEKSSKSLLELMQDGALNKRLNELNEEYPYWDRFKHKVKSFDYDSTLLWSYNKLLRDKSPSRIVLSQYSGFEFKYNTTNNMLKSLHRFDMNIGGIMEGRSIIPQDEKNRYLISSIMEEAIASSQLEGAATTREIAKQMLRSNRKPNTVDERMILNNYLTIKRVIEIKDKPFSKELILELHSIITKGTLKNKLSEGNLRESNDVNVVDGSTGEVFYIPPTFEKLEILIEDFCAFANHQSIEFIHPVVKGIFLHFFIGYIHPFVDGNGRTARAIFYWYLISKGYWLVEYMSISKVIIKAPAQYAKSYLHCEYDENDLTYFIDYNLKCMDLALNSLQSYIQRKITEKQNLFYLIKNENINERQAEMLKSIIIDNQKGFTIKEVQNKFMVAYQTARTDLLGLAILGYINERKYGKKLIFFKADNFEEKLEAALGK